MTQIIAHRGASHDAPENTLVAARLGWEQHAEAVEIDVHLSKDGHIVVMHDATTRRTTGQDGEIAALTLEELKQMDAGSWKAPQFAGERIPTLDEVLALVPPRKALVVEIKSKTRALIEPLEASLQRAGVVCEQIILIGFDYDLMKEIKATLPQWEVLWLSSPSNRTVAELIALCQEANFEGLNLSHRWPIDADFAREVHEANLKLYVWTVDNADTARRLQAAGVDGITTNRPAWLRAELEKAQPDAAQPDAAQPDAAQPDAAQPTTQTPQKTDGSKPE